MKHLNVIILGGAIITLSVLFGIATIKITGKYRFKTPATEMLDKVTENSQHLALDQAVGFTAKDTISFIDIRTPKEYIGFHIDNAINIPFERLLDDTFRDVWNTNDMKILYGNSSVEANAAWMILTQFGYDNLFVLDASAEDWQTHVYQKDIFREAHKGDEVARFNYDEVMQSFD
jgi:3-mercaptopyruvate sulfurtransferase SseA